MRRWRWVAVLSVVLSLPGLAWAVSSGIIPVTAQVDAVESLNCGIRKIKVVAGVEQDQGASADMAFGTLLRLNTCGTTGNAACALQGAHFYKVFCGANTSGRPYDVRQTGTTLTAGTNTLPNNAWVFAPSPVVDADADGAVDDPLPPGASVGPKATAGSTNALWYASGLGGKAVTLQSVYAIAGDPAGAVSTTGPLIAPDQPAGNYSATVLWTLTVL